MTDVRFHHDFCEFHIVLYKYFQIGYTKPMGLCLVVDPFWHVSKVKCGAELLQAIGGSHYVTHR